ncbi:MAG: DUF1931 family protein, partial [Cyanobacteria bacterium J083]
MTAQLIGVHKLEQLLRKVAGLNIDKSDLRRLNEFINQKVYDLLIVGQAVAKSNERDIIEPWDLPITKGLQANIKEFKSFDIELELQPILEQLATLPLLDLDYSATTESQLPEIVGGLIVSLGKSFKIIDPNLKNPQTAHWERAYELFS